MGNQRDKIDEEIKGQGAVLSACFPETTKDIMNEPLASKLLLYMIFIHC